MCLCMRARSMGRPCAPLPSFLLILPFCSYDDQAAVLRQGVLVAEGGGWREAGGTQEPPASSPGAADTCVWEGQAVGYGFPVHLSFHPLIFRAALIPERRRRGPFSACISAQHSCEGQRMPRSLPTCRGFGLEVRRWLCAAGEWCFGVVAMPRVAERWGGGRW